MNLRISRSHAVLKNLNILKQPKQCLSGLFNPLNFISVLCQKKIFVVTHSNDQLFQLIITLILWVGWFAQGSIAKIDRHLKKEVKNPTVNYRGNYSKIHNIKRNHIKPLSHYELKIIITFAFDSVDATHHSVIAD
ncbi:CLUMA_CG016652, isoform A [Clunio marinus]|uniref:CLUMA_CG016652, isoform A n=1 Tax=Clunio marinus TaxID=568069 RepID=A0A1J1IVK2_9DIPT|nr:CLUMA_CG016652, isoform A [Clunio marinus]